MLGLPLAALAAAWALGAGLVVTAAKRLPADAQAALGPVVGFAVVATASTFVGAGISVRLVTTVTFVSCILFAGVVWRRVAAMLRAAAVPLLIATVGIVLASAPSLAEGNWTAKSYIGNTDSYLWVSQARSFLDGPPQQPESEFPDRVAHERASHQHWAVALPVADAQLAWLSGRDPMSVYGGLAALVAALFPLSVFAVARCCLGWSSRLSALAGIAVAANASLLFASYFSWQQQLAGSALGFAAIGLLRLGLENRTHKAELVLAAFLAASSIAVYRMAFAPYLAASVGAVGLGYVLYSWERMTVKHALRAFASFAGAFIVLASPSIASFALGFGRFVEHNVNESFKRSFPEGSPTEALGLIPRIFGAPAIWILGMTVLTAPLLVFAYRELRRKRPPRVDFLLAGLAVLGAGFAAAVALPSVPPYASFKLLSYGAPFLILTMLAPVGLVQGRRLRLGLVLTLSSLIAASTTVAVARGIDRSRSAQDFSGLSDAAEHLPRNAIVSIDLLNPWDQAWAIYALRDYPVSVPCPEYILVHLGLTRGLSYYRHPHSTYVLGSDGGPGALWRSGSIALATRASRNLSSSFSCPPLSSRSTQATPSAASSRSFDRRPREDKESA